MPRRYHEYLPAFESLNQISSIGSWTIGVGFLIGHAVIVQSILKGEKAPKNPWGGKTLEWEADSPPIHENFEKQPVVTAGPYEYGR